MAAGGQDKAGTTADGDPKPVAPGARPGRRAVLGAAGWTLAGAALSGGPGAGRARAQGSAPEVRTASGRVSGAGVDGVVVFKGIPYAAPAGGANRFRPPQPLAGWDGVREAARFGASAPQPAPELTPLTGWYVQIEPVSEDCLSLNVFTPGLARDARRPVMVWLHGGAWWACAGSAPGFDGTALARAGDVVVVTINHRLNLFGFLRTDEGDERFADSGNAGVLDMVAALAWVRDNIEGFGGDPGNVTIFGQSGGGAKVSALMAAPAAKGLFHKAIAQSCSGSLRLAGREEAARLAHALATQLDVQPTMDALSAVPMEKLVAALAAKPLPFRPVLDERTFKVEPFDPQAPAISAGVPFMAGNAADETRLYLAADPRNFSLDEAEVLRRTARFLRIDEAEARHILDAYAQSLPGSNPSDRLAALTTDYTYRRNTTREAMLQSRSARAPDYAYVFTWATPVMAGLLRTPHTLEVPFVFGTTRAAAGLVGTGPALDGLTRTLTETWVAFARSGNPANPHLPAWPAYGEDKRDTMLIGTDSHVAQDPDGARRQAIEALPFFEYSMPVNYTHP